MYIYLLLCIYHFKPRSMLNHILSSPVLWLYLHPAGVVQGGHPPSGPRGLRLGGSRSPQRGGSVISGPRRPAVGFTVGREPAGPHWPQPGQPNWSAFTTFTHQNYFLLSVIFAPFSLLLPFYVIILWLWALCRDMTFASPPLEYLWSYDTISLDKS